MKTHAETRNFYETKLKISAEQITAISWDEVLQRLLTPELKATINSDSDAVQVDEAHLFRMDDINFLYLCVFMGIAFVRQ